MPDFQKAIAVHTEISEEAQKKAGHATGTTMDDKHITFLADLIAMLDRKEMDASVPASLLKKENYDPLPQTAKDLIDVALLNLADQLKRIEAYFRSSQTPNASPQLQTMIEHFWDMKSRLEDKHGDVLKF
ncbi:MAG: hypothetical protein HOO67_03630 [Candidatus Peribacteraceae bacterium]|nr:hypothetical protein [Candidatus Peribacteraceae bacterium]